MSASTANSPQRPSDALGAALATMKPATGSLSRLDSFEVRLLMALRDLGWDVTRRAKNGS